MMKRIFLPLTLALLLLLTACGAADDTSDNGELSAIANPWTDCKTLDDAVALAKFDITLPDSIDGYGITAYRVMPEKMLEIIYQASNNEIRIRKAPAQSSVGNDISGDYTNYSEHTAITTADSDVILDGNDGTISRALWTANDFSYSVTANPGISLDLMQHIVESVK